MLRAAESFVRQPGQRLQGEIFGHSSSLEDFVDHGAVQHLLGAAIEALSTGKKSTGSKLLSEGKATPAGNK